MKQKNWTKKELEASHSIHRDAHQRKRNEKFVKEIIESK